MKYLLLLLTLFVVSSPVLGQKVKIESGKGVDFSKFKTYSWTRGIAAKNPYVNMMLIEGIERNMAIKGFTKVDRDGDLQLSLSVAVDFDIQVSHEGWGNSGGSSLQTGIPSVGTAGAWDVRKGTIVLDILDKTSQNLVWHGLSSDTIKHEPSNDMQRDARKVEKQVKKAIEQFFKKIPPAGT